jgi:hypothetical protein
MRIITKELALRIVKKLEAQIHPRGNKPHDIAMVFHKGQCIAQFGLRRGSEKDLGHDHVSRDLHLGPHKARLLAQCPLTRDQWIQIMRDKGLLSEST